MISYDLENGNLIWECSGLTDNAIPCPIVEDGVAYCMTGYQGFSLLAVPISGKGDQSGKTLWKGDRGTPLRSVSRYFMMGFFILPSPTKRFFPALMLKQGRFSWSEPELKAYPMCMPRS